MLFKFQKFASPNIENLTVIFPVTGHRVFGDIERSIKKLDCIVKPEELLDIIKKSAEVLHIQESVAVYMKGTETWPFKIKSCKRLITAEVKSKTLIWKEIHYGFNAVKVIGRILLKKSKNIENVDIPTVNLSNNLSAEKRKDIFNLLVKYFSDDLEKECFERRMLLLLS